MPRRSTKVPADSSAVPLSLTAATPAVVQHAILAAREAGVPLVLVVPPAPPEPHAVDSKAAAAYLGVSPEYLRRHACPYLHWSDNNYGYRLEDLRAFAERYRLDPRSLVAPTSEQTASTEVGA